MATSTIAMPLRAFLRRDWIVERSYRLPFAMNLLGSGFVLVLIYQAGKLIAPTAGGAGSQLAKGYFSFAVIGTVIIQIVHTATQSFATKLREEQTTGTLEALLASPTPPPIVIVGSGMYDIVRAVLQAAVTLGVASAIGLRVELAPKWLAVALLVFVGLICLAAEIGVLVAAFTVVFKRGATLSGLINTGLALLAGVWYPVSSLPTAARWIADVIPFTWGLTALRDSLLFGRLDSSRILGLVLIAVAGLPLTLRVFTIAVDRAKVRGTLGQY